MPIPKLKAAFVLLTMQAAIGLGLTCQTPIQPPAFEPPVRAILTGHTNTVMSVALTPDGRTLASGGFDKTVRVWDVATGKERVTLRGHAYVIDFVVITPDGKTVASLDQRGVLKLWDVAAGRERLSLTPPTERAELLALAADGRTLFLGSGEGKFQLWDVASGRERTSLTFPPNEGVEVSRDGKLVALGHLVGELPSGRERARLNPEKPTQPVAFSPDAKTLATVTHRDDTILLWEVATGKVRTTLGNVRTRQLHTVAFHPGGRTMIWAYRKSGDPIRLVDVATGGPWFELKGASHNDGFQAAAFSADGNTLAGAEMPDTAIRVWDVRGLWKARPPLKDRLTDADLEALWADLAGDDAAKAYQAVWALAGAPEQAVHWLGQRLQPILAADAHRTEPLIADLSSDRFAVRDAATRELEKVGEAAFPALDQALAGRPTMEARGRVEQLLIRLEQLIASPAGWRVLRATEALEYAATPEARQLLAKLAGGVPQALLTREAKASLDRLKWRSP